MTLLALLGLALVFTSAGFVAGVGYVAWRETGDRLDQAQHDLTWDGGDR